MASSVRSPPPAPQRWLEVRARAWYLATASLNLVLCSSTSSSCLVETEREVSLARCCKHSSSSQGLVLLGGDEVVPGQALQSLQKPISFATPLPSTAVWWRGRCPWPGPASTPAAHKSSTLLPSATVRWRGRCIWPDAGSTKLYSSTSNCSLVEMEVPLARFCKHSSSSLSLLLLEQQLLFSREGGVPGPQQLVSQGGGRYDLLGCHVQCQGKKVTQNYLVASVDHRRV